MKDYAPRLLLLVCAWRFCGSKSANIAPSVDECYGTSNSFQSGFANTLVQFPECKRPCGHLRQLHLRGWEHDSSCLHAKREQFGQRCFRFVGSGLLQLRGGSGGDGTEFTDLSFQNKISRLQGLKDKMLAALDRGDTAAAREFSRELETLKLKAEKRLGKLEGGMSATIAPGVGARNRSGNMRRGGVETAASDDAGGAIAGDVHYLSLLRRFEVEIARRRSELEKQTSAKMAAFLAEARAGVSAVECDEHGRLLADESVHGLDKCENSSCTFCVEEHQAAPLDPDLSEDGIQESLDLPLVLHYVKKGPLNKTEHLLIAVPSCRVPLPPVSHNASSSSATNSTTVTATTTARPSGTKGLLVRLNESVYMVVEDRETLELLAEEKQVRVCICQRAALG